MLQSMTKVRFLKRDQLERKLYVEKCSSYLTQKIMLVRLNMNKTKENFRGKQDNSKCRLCSKDKETTEHLLGCSAMGTNTIDTTYLNQVDDIQMWKLIVIGRVLFSLFWSETRGDTFSFTSRLSMLKKK